MEVLVVGGDLLAVQETGWSGGLYCGQGRRQGALGMVGRGESAISSAIMRTDGAASGVAGLCFGVSGFRVDSVGVGRNGGRGGFCGTVAGVVGRHVGIVTLPIGDGFGEGEMAICAGGGSRSVEMAGFRVRVVFDVGGLLWLGEGWGVRGALEVGDLFDPSRKGTTTGVTVFHDRVSEGAGRGAAAVIRVGWARSVTKAAQTVEPDLGLTLRAGGWLGGSHCLAARCRGECGEGVGGVAGRGKEWSEEAL